MNISAEMIARIFGYLEPHEILSLQTVCKRWRWIANDESLWRQKYSNEFGSHPHSMWKESYKLEYHWKWGMYRVERREFGSYDRCCFGGDVLVGVQGCSVEIRDIKSSSCFDFDLEDPVDYVEMDPTQAYLVLEFGSCFQVLHMNQRVNKLIYEENVEEKTRKVAFGTGYFVRFTCSNQAFLYEFKKNKVGKRLLFFCERSFSPLSVEVESHTIHLAVCVELSHGWEPLVQKIAFESDLERFGHSTCLRREKRVDPSTGNLISSEYFDHVTRTIEIEPSSYAPASSILVHTPWLFFGHKDGSIHVHYMSKEEIIEHDVQYEHFSKVTCMAIHQHRLVTVSRGTIVLWEFLSCGRLRFLYRINTGERWLPLDCSISLKSVQVIYQSEQVVLCTYTFQ
jgi:hypothetical protein